MLISQIGGWTADMWGALIGLFNFIPSWGWMIIVFTVCLKLVLSPLDFWQKKMARASAQKQAILQPEIAKLQKKFGNNKQMLNQKTMELYKRENYNMFGSCIGMLINMALTLFIFMTLFYALIGIGQTQIYNQYDALRVDYNEKFSQAFAISNTETEIANKEAEIWTAAYNTAEEDNPQTEGETDADYEKRIYSIALQNYASTSTGSTDFLTIADIQNDVLNVYNTEVKQSWLWVANIWRPDTNASAFPDYSTFVSSVNFYSTTEYTTELNKQITDAVEALGENPSDADVTTATATATSQVQKDFENQYNFVTYSVQNSYSGWNGYFILTILAAVITYFSVTISQMQSHKKKKDETQIQTQNGEKSPVDAGKAMKFMKFLLPVLMIIFTIGYNAAFALYIVTNSIMATLLSFVFLKFFEKQEKKKTISITTKNKPDYSR